MPFAVERLAVPLVWGHVREPIGIEGFIIIFQEPLAQGLLADASPVEARGRVQGMAGAIGAIGELAAAFL
jgi:hypothetical protein